jgi:hypothetical protein
MAPSVRLRIFRAWDNLYLTVVVIVHLITWNSTDFFLNLLLSLLTGRQKKRTYNHFFFFFFHFWVCSVLSRSAVRDGSLGLNGFPLFFLILPFPGSNSWTLGRFSAFSLSLLSLPPYKLYFNFCRDLLLELYFGLLQVSVTNPWSSWPYTQLRGWIINYVVGASGYSLQGASDAVGKHVSGDYVWLRDVGWRIEESIQSTNAHRHQTLNSLVMVNTVIYFIELALSASRWWCRARSLCDVAFYGAWNFELIDVAKLNISAWFVLSIDRND